MEQMNQDASKSNNAQTRQTKESDIINIIIEDHKPLKELIEVMKDSERSPEERIGAFKEFAPTLIAHAKPEEELLYAAMKDEDETREDAFEGEAEHEIADQLVEEIKRCDDQDEKLARIKVLAELVGHHIEEEEEELLPDYKKVSDPAERAELGNEFLALKLEYLAAGNENIIPDPKSEKEAEFRQQ